MFTGRNGKQSLKQRSRWIKKDSQNILSIWRKSPNAPENISTGSKQTHACHLDKGERGGGDVQSSSPCFLSLSLCKQGWVIRQGWWGALEMWMGESENNELRYPSTHISSQFPKSPSAWIHFPFPQKDTMRDQMLRSWVDELLKRCMNIFSGWETSWKVSERVLR